MTASYLPEGLSLHCPENLAATESLSALREAMERGQVIEGRVERCERDLTLSVRLGDRLCRCPRAELAMGQVRDVAAVTRVGKPAAFQVMAIDEASGQVTLSRRLAQEQCAARYLSTLRPGDIIPARVTHLEQFGAFVDIGCGIVSLLSIDAISVSRIAHPRDRLAVGMELWVVVKAIDRESGRITLTHKELLGSWEENAADFEIGQTVPGIVRSVEDYGVFVELTPNLAGLAEYRGDLPIGTGVSVYIKNIIPDRMKLKLVIIDSGIRVAERTPMRYFLPEGERHLRLWRYSPRTAVRQCVTDFGA